MENISKAFEGYELQDGSARFYFSHSSQEFTTGILVMQPGAALKKHNRPGVENLVQISGKCRMTLFEKDDTSKDVEMSVGDTIKMFYEQWHIHTNPFDELSVTMFKLEGDIRHIVEDIRQSCKKVL